MKANLLYTYLVHSLRVKRWLAIVVIEADELKTPAVCIDFLLREADRPPRSVASGTWLAGCRLLRYAERPFLHGKHQRSWPGNPSRTVSVIAIAIENCLEACGSMDTLLRGTGLAAWWSAR